MRRILLLVFFLIQSFNFLIAKNNYINSFLSLDNSLQYNMIEYLIIKSNQNEIFILNQPYSINQVSRLFNNSDIVSSNLRYQYNYLHKNNRKVRFKNSLGFNMVDYHKGSPLKTYIKLRGIFDFKNTLLVGSIDLDKTLKDDILFHGDKKEWATAFIKDSYMLHRNQDIELFGGRISRNFGILNEYSLLFSNNPFPFDHYGFSVKNKKIKYSFYTTRLNNIKEGVDLQGIVIDNEITDLGDTLLNVQDTKRYFAIQRIDFKVSDKIQGALSASSVYGGPNQSFEAEYLNPLNIFYVSQRNSQIQMNNLYQLNLFYNISNHRALFVDFLIDDIIINNEEGYNGSDYKDNRFGLILKYSEVDFLFRKNLFSITYSKIWNETYLSYRNFENYIFFNKGIGYPYNSYESLKISISNFNFSNLLNKFYFQIYQKGNNSLLDTELFNPDIQEFPLNPNKKGLIFNFDLLYIGFKDFSITYSFNYNKKKNSDSETAHKFKLVYNFQY